MITKNKFDLASGAAFFLGAVAHILRHIPVPGMILFGRLIAGILYGFGYALWLHATETYPEQPRKKQVWYGFAESNFQQKIAASIGVCAAISLILGCIFPVAVLIASWLFALTNTIWLISTLHQKNNLRLEDSRDSRAAKKYYYYYALCFTLASIVNAVAATLVFVFPPAAPLILLIGFFAGSLPMLIGVQYFFKAFTQEQQNDPSIVDPLEQDILPTNSEKMSRGLAPQCMLSSDVSYAKLEETEVSYGTIFLDQAERNCHSGNPYLTFEPYMY